MALMVNLVLGFIVSLNEYFSFSLDDNFSLFDTEDWSAVGMINFLSDIGEFLSNSTLSHPNVQNLLQNEKHFDAVINEVFWVEALYGDL